MQYDVSALLLFRDHEESIGIAVERIARCLHEQALGFEVIAMDAGSRDNSVALLSVIRARYPELRIAAAPNPRRAHEHAASIAHGRVLWFIEPEAAARPDSPSLQSFPQARERILHHHQDLILAADHGLIAEREQMRRAVRGLRNLGRGLPRGLTVRARLMGLHVDTPHARPAGRFAMPRWVQPLFSALSS